MSFTAFALSKMIWTQQKAKDLAPSQLVFIAFLKSISKWTLVHNTDIMSFGSRRQHTQEEAKDLGFNNAFIENAS